MAPTDKRAEILHAALDLIAGNGFHGAPMAMIAERAQVAQGTIYCYFESKEILIFELHRFLVEKFEGALRREIPQGRPLRERFFHVGRGFVGYCLAAPQEFRFLEQFYDSPYGVIYRRDQAIGNADGGIFQELVAEGMEEQLLKRLPPTVLCALFFGPLLCLVHDHVFGIAECDSQMTEQAVAGCWDAIRA